MKNSSLDKGTLEPRECLFCGTVFRPRLVSDRFCWGRCARSHGDREGSPARVPTFALPGTRAKIEVMRARVSRGESCFHEDDGKCV